MKYLCIMRNYKLKEVTLSTDTFKLEADQLRHYFRKRGVLAAIRPVE